VDFLLECIGFPPDHDTEGLIERVRREGEPAAWRGPADRHLRLDLDGGLELRLDREPGDRHWNLFPHARVTERLRVAVESVRALPDSRFDALLVGWADPPASELEEGLPRPGAYPIAVMLTDARRLPADLGPGRVLAISLAGFALDVSYVGPNAGVCDPTVLELPHGALIRPLGGMDEPGGCADVSLRVREVRRSLNPLTGRTVERLVADAPGRPLSLFTSPWQLEHEGLPAPRPGWRVEGTFMFSGRIAGGVGGPARGVGNACG
jgi:hypothetical protein